MMKSRVKGVASRRRAESAEGAAYAGKKTGRGMIDDNLIANLYLKEILNSLADPIFVKDRKHRWVFLNDALCKFMGRSLEELIGKSDYDFFPKKEADVFWQKDEVVFRSGRENINEESFTDAKGVTHIISTKKTLYRDLKGRKFIVGVIRDITERKAMEEAILDSEARFEGMFRESKAVMLLVDPRDGAIVDANRAACRFYGYSYEKLKCMKNTEINTLTKKQLFREMRHAKVERRNHFFFKHRLAGGEIRDVEVHSSPVKLKGKVLLYAIVHDITSRKMAESALLDSREYLKRIINSISDPIFVKDDRSVFVLVNDALCRILGLPREDIIGKTLAENLPKDQMDHFLKVDRQVLKSGKENICEEPLLAKGGRNLTIVTKKSRYIDQSGKKFIVGVIRDITGRKRMEEELIESQNRQKAMLTNIPDLAWLKDTKSRFIAVNEPFARSCGIRPEKLIGKTDLDIWPRRLAERYIEDDKAVMRTGKRKTVEEPLADKQGKMQWIETIKTPIYGERGEIIGTTGIARDITNRKQMEEELTSAKEELEARVMERTKELTRANIKLLSEVSERKKAEDALRESEARLKSIFLGAPTGLGVLVDRVFVRVNKSMCDMVGYSEKELLGKGARIIYPQTEEYERVGIEKYGQINKYGKGSLETKWLRKDGRTIDVLLSSTVLDPKDRSKGVTFTALDITERKRMEKDMRNSEDYWRSLIEQLSDMIFLVDEQLVVKYESPSVSRILGYPPGHFIDQRGMDFIHPDDAAKIINDFSDVLQQKNTSIPTEFRLRHRDGRWLVLEVLGNNMLDHPSINGIILTVREITDRKLSEEALRKSEEKYRALAESSQDMIYTIGPDEVIQYVNKSSARQFGRDPKDLIGRRLRDLFPPEIYQSQINDIRDVFASGKPIYAESKTVFAEKEVWIDTWLIPIRSQSGSIESVMGISRDITERRMYEDNLRIRTRMLETLNDIIVSSNKVDSLSDFLKKSLALTLHFLGFEGGGIYLVDGQRKVAEIVHYENMPEEFINDVRTVKIDEPPFETVFSKGVPLISDQYDKFDPRHSRMYAYHSFASVPIIAKSQVIGALNVISSQRHSLSQDDKTLLMAIGQEMGAAIEKLKVEEQIRSSLKEKEVLLKEIHHRVKNNLQLISSMLNLQSKYIQDPKDIEVFNESQNRVRSMAIIHEKLYQSKDLARLDFAGYIDDLTTYLFRAYSINPDQIRLEVDVQDVSLTVNSAITCGLIINELVSNSIKYAFPDGRNGLMYLRMSAEEGRVVLYVGDDGVGLPPAVDFRNTRTLGLQLVNSLVEQMGGSIELNRSSGTEFKIILPGLIQDSGVR
jgi:PAS domain S-box-containing protein